MILALDPSSTRTGYAVTDDAGRVVDAGILKPNRADDPPNDRIAAMAAELPSLVREYGVREVVIEDTSGKVGGRHRGGGAGLAVYGKAVGWFIAVARTLLPPGRVHCVLENTWTRGRRKPDRASAVALAAGSPRQLAGDRGHDAADAIGLAQWFVQARRLDAKAPPI